MSLDFSIYKLQNAIAEAFDLDLSNKADLNIRAARLSRTLNKKGKFVLILDDVWSKIPFDIVGIPDKLNGCKVMLTARSSDVCQMMNCQKIVKVDCLEPLEEDWELFIKQLGERSQSFWRSEKCCKIYRQELWRFTINDFINGKKNEGNERYTPMEECIRRIRRIRNELSICRGLSQT